MLRAKRTGEAGTPVGLAARGFQRFTVPVVCLLLLGHACGAEPPSGPGLHAAMPGEGSATSGSNPARGDAPNGRVVFARSCSPCHASRDAIDLAYFRFPDSTIIRRALKHITPQESQDVAAYVATLNPARGGSRSKRIYQPGGAILASDIEFAVRLFGEDAWPSFDSFGTARLLALNPLDVPVALPLPLWSDESSNLDWLGSEPFPTELLTRIEQRELAEYYATRSVDALMRFVAHANHILNSRGPCTPADLTSAPMACFEAKLWLGNLVGQHLLRSGFPRQLDHRLTETWWDVGYAARAAFLSNVPLDNVHRNWATWMYFGWLLERPFRHNVVYMGPPLEALDLRRHMTFVALRSAVERPEGDVLAYEFVYYAAEFSRAGAWTHGATVWGYRHLLERLAGGDVPANEASARHWTTRALERAQPKVSAVQYAALMDLHAQIMARLQ